MTSPAATAQTDQYQAACRDALGVLHALARSQEVPVHLGANGWLRDHLRALEDAITAGTARPCPHLRPAPRVIHAAVWAPGQLACGQCAHQLTPDAIEDATCDRCRRYVTRIHPCVVAAGPVLFRYGLCRACHAATMPHRVREDRRS